MHNARQFVSGGKGFMDCLATARHYTGGNWIMFSPGFKCFAKIFYHKDKLNCDKFNDTYNHVKKKVFTGLCASVKKLRTPLLLPYG